MSIRLRIAFVVSAATMLATTGIFVYSAWAGPLTPPPGPVTGTYKTLSEVEPRTAISGTNTPGDADSLFKITQPGSYYLTGNITGVSGKHGVKIAVGANGPSVTIDLMGFELAGVPGSLDGISATVANTRNIAIRNGTVRAWGGDGIDVSNSQNNSLVDLRVQSNGARGISGSAFNTITGCAAQFNGQEGIRTMDASTLADCTANFNTGHGFSVFFGSTMTRCAANFNGGHGISADQACIITACGTFQNSADGIRVTSDCTISACTARVNAGNGIHAGLGSTVSGCTVSNNALGITTGGDGTITGCTVNDNSTNGISINGSNSQVTDNVCTGNGDGGIGSGIYTNGNSNRIAGNTVTRADFGIFLDGAITGNVVVGNVARGNTTNYSNPASGNFIGTLIGTSGAMNTATNSLVNISF